MDFCDKTNRGTRIVIIKINYSIAHPQFFFSLSLLDSGTDSESFHFPLPCSLCLLRNLNFPWATLTSELVQ